MLHGGNEHVEMKNQSSWSAITFSPTRFYQRTWTFVCCTQVQQRELYCAKQYCFVLLATLFSGTYIGGEGAAHELLPVSILGLSGVASLLEVLQGGAKVLDIILQLVHSPEGKQIKNTSDSSLIWSWKTLHSIFYDNASLHLSLL